MISSLNLSNITNDSLINGTDIEGVDGDTSPFFDYLALLSHWSCSLRLDSPLGLAVNILAFGILIFGVTFGNVLTIVAILTTESLQTETNAFLVSLAITDLLAAFSIPASLLQQNQILLISDVTTCTFSLVMLWGGGMISIYHLLSISFERYVAIVYPFKYHTLLTPTRMKILLVLTWAIPFFVLSLPAMGWRYSDISDLTCHYSRISPKDFQLLLFFFIFLFPLGSMTFFYARIFYEARQQAKKIADHERAINRGEGKSNTSSEMKAVKTILIVWGIFMLCWLPLFILVSAESLTVIGDYTGRCNLIMRIVYFLAMANSGMNPLIYSLKNKDMRAAFKRLLKIRRDSGE